MNSFKLIQVRYSYILKVYYEIHAPETVLSAGLSYQNCCYTIFQIQIRFRVISNLYSNDLMIELSRDHCIAHLRIYVALIVSYMTFTALHYDHCSNFKVP